MRKFIVALTVLVSVFAFSSCKKENQPVEEESNNPLCKTSWVYCVPDDADQGKMAITFIDNENCFLVNGDKDGWWWSEDDGFTMGKYTYDSVENLGTAFDLYAITFTEEGQLSLGGLFLMDQVEFFNAPE